MVVGEITGLPAKSATLMVHCFSTATHRSSSMLPGNAIPNGRFSMGRPAGIEDCLCLW